MYVQWNRAVVGTLGIKIFVLISEIIGEYVVESRSWLLTKVSLFERLIHCTCCCMVLTVCVAMWLANDVFSHLKFFTLKLHNS